MITVLSVDVYCTRGEGNPSYRIFVDNEMLTERSWSWPAYEVFIRENIEVDLEPGPHRVEIRECSGDPVFILRDIMIDGNPNSNGLFFT
jgi:hypothetical protein